MQYHMRDYVQALRVLYNGLRVIWGPRVVSSATRGTIKALNDNVTKKSCISATFWNTFTMAQFNTLR